MMHFNDPPAMPGTGEGPAERFASAGELAGSAAAAYLQKRHVPLNVAEAADVRFDAQFAGRAAVIVALRDSGNRITSLHGRYVEVRRGQNKMLTFGSGGGVIAMPAGLQAEQPILVEGLFDALSLASCGWTSVATIGRWAPWLAEHWAGKTVWVAFDAGKPGEAGYSRYAQLLCRSRVRRLLPPPRCQDWNTALVKRGTAVVARWVQEQMAAAGTDA